MSALRALRLRARRSSWRDGLLAGSGLALPVFVVAIAFGLQARALGWTTAAAVVRDGIVVDARALGLVAATAAALLRLPLPVPVTAAVVTTAAVRAV